MARGSVDLTTGGIFEKLLKVAVPIMGVQLLNMTYNLVDMFWLGRLSSDAVAASGTAGMYMWLSVAFLMFGRMGAEIGVSQSLGRGDSRAAARFSGVALTVNLAAGTAFALVMIVFAPQLVGFFGIPEAHVAADAVTYLRWVAPCLPFQFMTAAISGTFSACGNTRVPFYISIVGLVFNSVADPLFIFTFKLGVAGAAMATALAIIVTALAGLWIMRRPHFRLHDPAPLFARPQRSELKTIVRWALPVSVESFCFTFLSMLVSRVVAGFGSGAIAAQKLGSQIESLSWLIAGGFASALTAFVGQNYGAGQWRRIRLGTGLAYRAMALWGLLVTALLFWGGGWFFSLFVEEAPVVAGGAVMLRYTVIGVAATCLENVALGAFRGIGRTLPPAIVSISVNVARVPLSYFLARTSLGVRGVWLGLALGALARGAWMMLWQITAARKDPQHDLTPHAASSGGEI